MAKSPTWIGSYIKLGKEAFDEYTLSILRLIEKKYTEDYLTFLTELKESFPGASGVSKLAVDLEKKIKSSVKIIRDLRGWYGGRATKSEVKELYSLLQDIEVGIKELAAQSGASRELKAVLSNIEQETNISLEEIQKAQTTVAKAMSGIKATKKRKKEKKDRGIARGVLSGFMGTTAAGVTIGATRLPGKIYRGAKGAVGKAGSRKMLEQLTPVAFPSDIRQEKERGVPATAVGGTDLTTSLYTFFNKQAFSAAWTRDVIISLHSLTASLGLKGATKDSKGGLSGGLKGLLAGAALKDLIKPFLGIAAGLGIAGVGVAGMRGFGKKQLTTEMGQIGYEAEIDRLRGKQGVGPIARPTKFVEDRQGRIAFAKLMAGEKLGKEDWSALWEQQKKYAGKALERGKSTVQKGVTALTGIKFGGSPFKSAEIEMAKTAERIVDIRKQNEVLAQALREQLGVGKKPEPPSEDPFAKMDKTTREFMQKQLEALNRLDKTVDKLAQQRVKKDIIPLKKDNRGEADTSSSWMKSNSQ